MWNKWNLIKGTNKSEPGPPIIRHRSVLHPPQHGGVCQTHSSAQHSCCELTDSLLPQPNTHTHTHIIKTPRHIDLTLFFCPSLLLNHTDFLYKTLTYKTLKPKGTKESKISSHKTSLSHTPSVGWQKVEIKMTGTMHLLAAVSLILTFSLASTESTGEYTKFP